jgi:hypothetical protein
VQPVIHHYIASLYLVPKPYMKKQFVFYPLLLLLLVACNKIPKVFSVNNFTMVQDSARAVMGVTALPLPDITGHWTGLEHNIDINLTNGINGVTLYAAGLIDTMHSRDSGSTWFDVHFMATGGKPWVEVIDWGGMGDEHDYTLTTSIYLKINKLTADTIIVQMLNNEYTEGWLQKKGYRYFVTAQEKHHTDHTLYLTEDLPRLTLLLKELYRVPKAFMEADTIVRRKESL